MSRIRLLIALLRALRLVARVSRDARGLPET